MSALGKCFAFHVKYETEMTKYFSEKQPAVDFPDPDEARKMIDAVGEKCREEVAEFLRNCTKIMDDHFNSIGGFALGKLSSKKWQVCGGVWSGNKPKIWRMEVGVDIPRGRREIIPWVKGVGKHDAEERMIVEFGDSAIRSSEVDLPAGTVALARISVLEAIQDGFEIDNGELLNKVQQAFLSITKYKFENVYNYVKAIKG